VTVSAAQAAAFYREAVDGGEVWAVRDQEGYPAPKNPAGQRAMPFWSKESRAARVVAQVPAYRGFDVVRIPLDEWRDEWLPNLARDGLLVGLNWSGPRATGYDMEPSRVEAALPARRKSRLPRWARRRAGR
jgi:hypothetical protein